MLYVRKTGKRKGALNGYDVRKIVYEAHGNNSASWLACAVGISLPEWFANLWLPIRVYTHETRNMIWEVWAALREVAEPGSPMPSDDVAEFVWRCRDQHVKGNYRIEAADLPSTHPMKRRNVVLLMTQGNVCDALRLLGPDAFPRGAAQRSLRMHAHPWVPSALLTACFDFVTTGGCIMGEVWLFAQLIATQTEAAVEMAAAHGIIPQYDEADPDEMFEIIASVIRRRDITESFAALGMEVVFYDDENVIEEVIDTVTRVSGNDLDMMHGVEMWTTSRRGHAEHIKTLGPKEMRSCFDRHAAMTSAGG
jgi:hypothetical protein